MLPQNGEGGVIFCEPLVCNSIHYMSISVVTVHTGHVNTCSVRDSLWLKAQGKLCARAVFLQGAVWATLCVAAPFALLSHLPSFVRSFARCHTSFVRLVATTGSRPSDSPRVPINIDRASRDLAYFLYHLPVDRISWAFPYVPPGLYTQLWWPFCAPNIHPTVGRLRRSLKGIG